MNSSSEYNMVSRTGFEPVNDALRGRCVNRFTNEPVLNYYSLSKENIQQKTVRIAPFFSFRF